jgi:thiamine-phosphate pyrophosphorylase
MTDDDRLSTPLQAAAALPRGSMVIVRGFETARVRRLAGTLLRLARRNGFAVLIAGDACLAAGLGADGVHLPEKRAGEAAHWRARYSSMTITASAHSLRALTCAANLPLDAIFLSPVFATASHPARAALLPERAAFLARLSRIPVYALGGIDACSIRRIAPRVFAGIGAIGALSV